jgi:hypothetical protein
MRKIEYSLALTERAEDRRWRPMAGFDLSSAPAVSLRPSGDDEL